LQHESKKHHYVPQSLLKYFSTDRTRNQIYVFDKTCGKAALKSIKKFAGLEHDFNKLETENGVWNFEHLFQEVDDRLAILLKLIHRARNLSVVTADDRRDWADMVAVQLLRTPIMRTTMTQIAVDLVDSLAESGLAKPEDFSLPTDNDSRRSMVKTFLDRNSLRIALEDKDFVLFEGAGSTSFFISDHPVVRQSTVPYGDSGLSSPGVGVYLPLGPDLVLAMLCKSVKINLNARPIEELELPQESAQRLIALREGLRTGLPVRWSDNSVACFNALQIAGSSRFLYGSQNAFDAVRAKLEAHPELRHVKSHVQIGSMGSAPPPANRMPDGQWLVLFGQSNHYMLSIQNWQAKQCEGETRDLDVLNRALADAAFKEMQQYVDKQQCQMKRNVRVEILTNSAPVRFRIRYADPAMDTLDAAINR